MEERYEIKVSEVSKVTCETECEEKLKNRGGKGYGRK